MAISVVEAIVEFVNAGDVLLSEKGVCFFHHRRDGQVTIYAIATLPQYRRQGVASRFIQKLKSRPGVTSLFAKVKSDNVAANQFFQSQGFVLERTETLKTGTVLNCWRLWVQQPPS